MPKISDAHSGISGRQPSAETAPFDLDSIDDKIVRLLQQDGRMSFSDLGNSVGLTSGGARMRVKRLEERGILRVIGVTSAYELGLRSIAMLQIEIDGDIDEVADALAAIDGVRYVVLGSGSFSILAEVYAQSPAGVFALINRQVRQIPGVSRVETFSYHSVHTHKPVFSLSRT